MRTLTVGELFEETREECKLRFISGKSGKTRQINSPKIQKSGLVFAGIFKSFHPERIQIAGEAEMIFFDSLAGTEKVKVLERLCKSKLPGIIFSGGISPPPGLKKKSANQGLPVFVSDLGTSVLIEKVITYLNVKLAKRTTVHGVLMDVYGVGVLITGPSGIGKSECALDLIIKGHRFVADDVIEVEKRGPNTLLGRGGEVIRHFMEIRGLGIINIKDLFGLSAIVSEKKVDLVIELEEWDSDKQYDRTGITDRDMTLLGVKLPSILFPVSPARDLSTLVEVAVRNYLLKLTGVHSAKHFASQHRMVIREKGKRDRKKGQ